MVQKLSLSSAMLTSTVEDYLKALFRLGGAGRIVQIGHIAEAVGVTAGTVTTMMKHLQASGLAHYMPRRGVRLSEPGRLATMRVIRRHRLVELFLVDVLGMDMAEVHPEAEILEHALSERLTDLIRPASGTASLRSAWPSDPGCQWGDPGNFAQAPHRADGRGPLSLDAADSPGSGFY